jgi:pseudouridine synthase
MTQDIPLQKWLMRLGMGSKRQVRLWIREGEVQIGDQVCTRYAEPVTPETPITVRGIPVGTPPEPLVWLMNKPKKHITGLVDPDGRPTLAPYLPADLPRLFHVGRLDFNTEGALLWTNDGALARRILHPECHLPKVYQVKIRGHLEPEDPGLARMRDGMDLGDFHARPCTVELLDYRARATWVQITLTQGRYRQVRRMCASASFQIVKLRRVAIGPIELGELNPRCARPLDDLEQARLRAALGLPPSNPAIAGLPSGT